MTQGDHRVMSAQVGLMLAAQHQLEVERLVRQILRDLPSPSISGEPETLAEALHLHLQPLLDHGLLEVGADLLKGARAHYKEQLLDSA